MKILSTIFFIFLIQIGLTQESIVGYQFGSSSKDLPLSKKDISNPQSWEETDFEISEKKSFLGFTSSQTQLKYFNDRLLEVKLTFPDSNYELLKKTLENAYALKKDTSGLQSASYLKKNIYIYIEKSGDSSMLYISDNDQKEFHFTDIFKGVLMWIIASIVGLFVLNWFFAKLINGYCKKCHSFNMEFKEIQFDNYKDYSLHDGYQFLERPQFHHDRVYKFQCKKCGHLRNDRYSGFWSWLRSKE